MTLTIRAQGFPLTRALKKSIESRLRMTLNRYYNAIRRVDVSLTDINGSSKGGMDMRCMMSIKLSQSKSIVVQETGEDMYEAIRYCSERVRHTLQRHLGRQRAMRRRGAVLKSVPPLEAA